MARVAGNRENKKKKKKKKKKEKKKKKQSAVLRKMQETRVKMAREKLERTLLGSRMHMHTCGGGRRHSPVRFI